MVAWRPVPLTLIVGFFVLVNAIPLNQNLYWKSSWMTDPINNTISVLSIPELTTRVSSSLVPGPSSMQAYPPISSGSFPSASSPLPFSSLPSTAIETVIGILPGADVPPTTTISEIAAVSTLSPPSTSTAWASSSTTKWVAPSQFTSLGDFNIFSFPSGKNNLEIVRGIPAEASASIAYPGPVPSLGFLPTWDNSSSVIQVLYPANSVDPANRPQGGADFYAAPLEHLNTAMNVSLGYSVFFPVDFDWVRGGKLPGLYGGHNGCSGGNDALSCFSTRLMWRTAGAGELYLYAPKSRQTVSLCSDALSVCDETYGLSIGRGSFYFRPGAWTYVKQTVVLNTPGQQDGGFILEVNGQVVINRTDVFYRDVPPVPISKGDYSGSDGDDTGDLISHLFGYLVRRYKDLDIWGPILKISFSASTTVVELDPDPSQWDTELTSATATNMRLGDIAVNGYSPSPVGFIGLFFSTFFGGHEPEYATPIDQYTWFKDFSITVNA